MSCAPTGEDDAASAMWLTPDEVTALREAWDRYGRALTTDTELVQFFFELGIDIASSQLAAPTPSNAADHPSSSSPGTAANDHRGGLSRWVPCESFDDVKALARHLKWEHQANTESDGELAFAAVQTAAAAQRGSTSGEASIARAAIQSLLRPFGIALDSAFAPPANIAASQRRRSSVAPPSRRPSDVSATNVAMAKSLEEDLGPPLAVQDFARLFGQPTHAETSLKGQLLGFRFASSTMAKGKATTLSGSTSLRTTVVTDGMAASVSPHRKSTFARKATMRLPAADRKESTAIPSPSVHGTVAGELGGRLGGSPTSMARSFLSVSMATHEQSVNALAGQSVLGRVKLLSEAPPPTTQIGGVPEGSGEVDVEAVTAEALQSLEGIVAHPLPTRLATTATAAALAANKYVQEVFAPLHSALAYRKQAGVSASGRVLELIEVRRQYDVAHVDQAAPRARNIAFCDDKPPYPPAPDRGALPLSHLHGRTIRSSGGQPPSSATGAPLPRGLDMLPANIRKRPSSRPPSRGPLPWETSAHASRPATPFAEMTCQPSWATGLLAATRSTTPQIPSGGGGLPPTLRLAAAAALSVSGQPTFPQKFTGAAASTVAWASTAPPSADEAPHSRRS